MSGPVTGISDVEKPFAADDKLLPELLRGGWSSELEERINNVNPDNRAKKAPA